MPCDILNKKTYINLCSSTYTQDTKTNKRQEVHAFKQKIKI